MKKQMSRWGSFIATLLLCFGLMTGCGGNVDDPESAPTSKTTASSVSETETTEAEETTTAAEKSTTWIKVIKTRLKSTTEKTTTTTKETYKPITAADKPKVQNTAEFLKKMSSPADAKADALRKSILTAGNQLPKSTGKTYYVSNNGDNSNDGLSEKTPLHSMPRLRSGDTVLFERGGVYYGMMIGASSGVNYGAYGTGDKPCLYGARENAAEKSWRKYAKNIWESPYTYAADVGIVVFNHGEHVGARETAINKMMDEYDYAYANGRVYVYMEDDPADVFSHIAIGMNHPLIQIGTGITDVCIDNLCLKYTGGHGISALSGVKNIRITNCEIGWIGGSYLTGYKDGTARFGNGVEFWESCDNVKVENCWVYQIYDSGLSHQGKQQETVVNNLTFRNNLVEYTSYNAIEYWTSGLMSNILYEGNIMRFSGYGWGELNRPNTQAITLATAGAGNRCENFIIRQNVFDVARVSLFNCGSGAGTFPALDSNTYIQSANAYLGSYNGSKRLLFGADAATLIKEQFGDKNPTVLFAD